VVKTAQDRTLSIDEGPMWHSGLIRMLAQLETGQGNQGKMENTIWEGRAEVYCHVWSSEGGSPCLCRLSPTSIGPH
jgi:hypothetical protein